MMLRGETDRNGDILADLDGVQLRVTLVRQGNELTILAQGESHQLTVYDPLVRGMDKQIPAGSLTAPMPGAIIQVMVAEGDTVAQGDALMILEAMKWNIPLPRRGMAWWNGSVMGWQIKSRKARNW